MNRWTKIDDDIVPYSDRPFTINNPTLSDKLPYNNNFDYSHNFSRIMQHLNAVLAASQYQSWTLEEAETYRNQVIEAVNNALCYIPEVKILGNDR